MTEAEWLRSQNPARMLRQGVGILSVREVLLIGCGCYRMAWGDIPIPELRSVIEEAERAADDKSSPEENRRAFEPANYARNMSTATEPGVPPMYKTVNGRYAAWAAYSLNAIAGMNSGGEYLLPEMVGVMDDLSRINRKPSVNRRGHADIIRCVFGNPFRPVDFDPSWRSETAIALATGIYAERAFDRMPILADVLEEAGCDHADVLTHCRNPGIHARGCWVVDSVLGKR